VCVSRIQEGSGVRNCWGSAVVMSRNRIGAVFRVSETRERGSFGGGSRWEGDLWVWGLGCWGFGDWRGCRFERGATVHDSLLDGMG
jgi:hypothetical protein